MTGSRHFSSNCVIPSEGVSGAARASSVAVPGTRTAQPNESVELVYIDGVPRQIVLRCDCGEEHRIDIDYQPSSQEQD